MQSLLQRLCKEVLEGKDPTALEELGKEILRRGYFNLGEPNGWVVMCKEKFWNAEGWDSNMKLIFDSVEKAKELLARRLLFYKGDPEDLKIVPVKSFLLPEVDRGVLPTRTIAPAIAETCWLDRDGNVVPVRSFAGNEEISEEVISLMREFGMEENFDLVAYNNLPLIDLSIDLPEIGDVPELLLSRNSMVSGNG